MLAEYEAAIQHAVLSIVASSGFGSQLVCDP
jgi:hypothetical protein